jgi:transcriptional/translational regulatory protein YebC/TACO1
VYTEAKNLQKVQAKLIEKGIKITDSGLVYLPKSTVKIDENTRLDYEKLLEQLDEQDDVDEIFDNIA